MENYLMKIQYIGNRFHGFQKQPGILTVQGLIEDTLSLILRSKINTVGASRTDRGVNALNQYLNFYFPQEIDKLYLIRKLNGILYEKGIYVKEIKKVDILFHSRKSARGKIYAYVISQNPQIAMFMFPYIYFYKEKIDFDLMDEAIKWLIGEHDFSIFANRDRSQPERDNICRINKIGVLNKGEYFVIYFLGDRFLYHMIRRMVYYLLKASSKHIDLELIKNPFITTSLPFSRQVLPPEPLFLVDVLY